MKRVFEHETGNTLLVERNMNVSGVSSLGNDPDDNQWIHPMNHPNEDCEWT